MRLDINKLEAGVGNQAYLEDSALIYPFWNVKNSAITFYF